MQAEDLVRDLRKRLIEKNMDFGDYPDIRTAPDEIVVTFGIIAFCCELKPGTQLEGAVNSDQVEWALEQADDTDDFLEIYAENCLHVDIKDQEDGDEGEDKDDNDER